MVSNYKIGVIGKNSICYKFPAYSKRKRINSEIKFKDPKKKEV